ncbi:hypothetical protein EMCRGX_G033954 [Ephydatia muelleri]
MEDADDEPLFADDLEGLSDQDDVPPLPPPMPSFDDVDGLPRSPPPEPAAGVASNAEAGDGQPAQKKRKPLLTLTNERIFSEKGIPYLPKEFSKLKFRGKGNEAADLAYLLKQYEHWANRLFPKLTSTDVTDRIESLAKKKEFKGQLKDLRRRWIRGSTPPIIDDDDDDMGNANSRGSGDGATGAGGDGATGTGGDGASDEDDDLWGDIRERPLATIRPHSRNVTHDAEKENSPPSGNGAEGSWKLALDTEDQRTSEGGSRPKGDSRSTEGSWKLELKTEDQHTSEGSSRSKGDSRSTEGSWKLAMDTEDHHTSEGSSRSKGGSRSTEGSWKLAMDTEDHHTSEGSSRSKGDSRSTEGSWKLAMDTEDHHTSEGGSRPKGDSRSTEGSWKLALDTEDHHTSEGSSRSKGGSKSTEGSWKLAMDTEDHHTSEGSSRSKGDSRSTEGSWKLALDTEEHHTSEGSSRPKGGSRSTEGSWKLALDTEEHHTSEGSSRPKGGSRSTEGSWKLELKTDDNHTLEAISRSGGDRHSWRSALGSDNSHSPVLDKGDSHGPKGRRLAASANETPTEVVQGQGYNGDGAEEFHFDDRHLSPVLEGRGYRSSRELALDKDNRCTTDIHGDDENSEPHTESRDSYTASPVLNSRRCSSHKRQQLVWSDDSEDELKLCIDEDSAKEE